MVFYLGGVFAFFGNRFSRTEQCMGRYAWGEALANTCSNAAAPSMSVLNSNPRPPRQFLLKHHKLAPKTNLTFSLRKLLK